MASGYVSRGRQDRAARRARPRRSIGSGREALAVGVGRRCRSPPAGPVVPRSTSTAGWPDVGAGEHLREDPQELRDRDLVDSTRTSSSPSSRSASGQTCMPPPYDGPLPTATSIASVSRRVPVELDDVRDGAEHRQLAGDREVVAHPPLRPAPAVGPLVDERRRSRRRARRDPPAADARGRPPCRPASMLRDPAGVDEARCRGGVVHRQAEVAGDVVAGAGGDDGERHVRCRRTG